MNKEITKTAEKKRGRCNAAEEGAWMPLPPQPGEGKDDLMGSHLHEETRGTQQ